MSNAIEALVNAGIDVKLNKTDLIEMIVTEREDALEAAVENAKAALTKAEENLDDLTTQFISTRVASGEKLAKPLIGNLTKIFVVEKPKVKVALTGSYKLGGLETGGDGAISHSVSRINKVKGHKYDYDAKVDGLTNIRLRIKDGEYGGYVVDSKLRPTKLTVAEQKLQDRLVEAANIVAKLNTELGSLRTEQNNLNKMGKRAKAKLVKEFLMSTEQGEELMASMSKISRVKLLK